MSETQTREITLRMNEPAQMKGRKVDIPKAVELRLKGLSYSDIAKHFDCSKSAVKQALDKYCPDAVAVDVYRKNEGALITAKKSMILNAITPEKVADATAFQLTGMFGIMVDKSRLVEGKSTANIEAVIQDAMSLANSKDEL